MEEKKELKDLKPGDNVLLQDRWQERIYVVERLTKTQIKLEGIPTKFHIKDGWSVGRYSGYITIPTDEDYKRMREKAIRNRLESEIKDVNFLRLPSDKLERILKIVNE